MRKTNAKTAVAVVRNLPKSMVLSTPLTNVRTDAETSLLTGVALELAKHDRNAIALGEPVDLLMEHFLQLGAGPVFAPVKVCRDLRDPSFVPAPPGGSRPST